MERAGGEVGGGVELIVREASIPANDGFVSRTLSEGAFEDGAYGSSPARRLQHRSRA